MSSSGLIYAVIVGAWAAYLVPMWLRRQDELNEARPTERFSTAIRLLSGRAGMERRYARDLRARSAEAGEPDADPDAVTEPVDVRAFATPPGRPQGHPAATRDSRDGGKPPVRDSHPAAARDGHPVNAREAQPSPAREAHPGREAHPAREVHAASAREAHPASVQQRVPAARRTPAAPQEAQAAARAQRSKVLARRRRTTIMLFLAFTFGAVVAAVGGLAFLWAPGVPAVMLSGYIAYLRTHERRRFAYQMDRQRAEAAAQRLKERVSQPHRRQSAAASSESSLDAAEEPETRPEPETDPGLLALAADRRALVEQTDHAEWVDQQRERQRRPDHGDSWDPVPVPLPTYVTAPVAPRATPDVDLGAPDTWSSARSSAVAPDHDTEDGIAPQDVVPDDGPREEDGERSDARRAASARRSRERGRTPLFDQYEDGERPRAANE